MAPPPAAPLLILIAPDRPALLDPDEIDTWPLATASAELIETSPLDVAEPAPLANDTEPPDDDPVLLPPVTDTSPPFKDDAED